MGQVSLPPYPASAMPLFTSRKEHSSKKSVYNFETIKFNVVVAKRKIYRHFLVSNLSSNSDCCPPVGLLRILEER